MSDQHNLLLVWHVENNSGGDTDVDVSTTADILTNEDYKGLDNPINR